MAAREFCERFGAVCRMSRGRFWAVLVLVAALMAPMASLAVSHTTAATAVADCQNRIVARATIAAVDDCAANSCDQARMSCGIAGCMMTVAPDVPTDAWHAAISFAELGRVDSIRLARPSLLPRYRPPILMILA